MFEIILQKFDESLDHCGVSVFDRNATELIIADLRLMIEALQAGKDIVSVLRDLGCNLDRFGDKFVDELKSLPATEIILTKQAIIAWIEETMQKHSHFSFLGV